MKGRAAGEVAFESFCVLNLISFERLSESDSPTPDFKIVDFGAGLGFGAMRPVANGKPRNPGLARIDWAPID